MKARTAALALCRPELDLILCMMAIASASDWGEGDYRNFDKRLARAFDSLQEKLAGAYREIGL